MKSPGQISRAVLLITLGASVWRGVQVTSNPDSQRLYVDLLSNYNRVIRPVYNNSERVLVKMGLKLSQLVDVEWNDYRLTWDPEEYGGVESLYVPSEHIWLPDIVLYNNADGEYVITTMTKAILHYTGVVNWKPPAVYKSSCEMNVEFFPFDEQMCFMKFGSWSYDGFKVDLKHLNQDPGSSIVDIGIDLQDFYLSVEWDVMNVTAQRFEKYYLCCEEPFPDMKFNLTLRRKTLFYTVNLIAPCVGITLLSVLVFYLPADSGEKISLSIFILVSLNVFFLLLIEIIPATSITVSLLGKYLLFTMVLVTCSAMGTIAVLNLNFRSPSTHRMASWVRKIFIGILPKFVMLQKPKPEDEFDADLDEESGDRAYCFLQEKLSFQDSTSASRFDSGQFANGTEEDVTAEDDVCGLTGPYPIMTELSRNSPEIGRAIYGIHFITQHIQNENRFSVIEEDWKYVAMVLDRLFLWIFSLACVIGTASIILQAPMLWDKRRPIDVQLSKFAQKRFDANAAN